MAKVIVVGGAGYVGSHTACAYKAHGHEVVVVDDLSSGKAEHARWGPLYRDSANDPGALKAVMRSERPDLIVHCAGAPAIAWSGDHAELHRVHIGTVLTVLEAMIEAHVRHIVFASSCETYGAPERVPINERQPQAPRDPYAWSLYVAENIIQDLARAHDISFAIVRVFNVVGASDECRYGGDYPAPFNPLPPMLDALTGIAHAYELPGVDHPTRDGTLERDVTHVSDVARAHVLAGARLLGGGASLICNLGRGRGVTLNEMLVMLRRVSGARINVSERLAAPGEAARLFAAGNLAQAELGWKPKVGVEAAIRSAVEARGHAIVQGSGGAS